MMDNVTGLDEFTNSIEALKLQLHESLPQIVLAAANIVFDEINGRIPRDTGDLAGHLDESQNGAGAVAYVTIQVGQSGPGGNERKGIFLEYGTSKMAARPFFRPGVDASREKAEQLLQSRILKVIDQ
ncbi:MAG: hypothetical protein M3Y65_16855 [Pseudomonadota bacterium]|nr:hypothetical protein [Pseudomonadota bacterium]